jgi:hypothetical protein
MRYKGYGDKAKAWVAKVADDNRWWDKTKGGCYVNEFYLKAGCWGEYDRERR